MKLVTLSELKEILLVSDAALVYLLENQHLSLNVDKSGKLLVDIDAIEKSSIVKSLVAEKDRVFKAQKDLLVEKVAGEIGNQLDDILESAILVALERSSNKAT